MTDLSRPMLTLAAMLLLMLAFVLGGCNGESPTAPAENGSAAPPPEQPAVQEEELPPPPRMTLYRATWDNDIEQIKANIAHGADLNGMEQDSTGGFFAPIHLASRAGFVEAARILIDAGADVNIRARAPHRATPLHWACRAGNYDIVVLLVEHGNADINALMGENMDMTPLDWAVNTERYEIVAYLNEQGAKLAGELRND